MALLFIDLYEVFESVDHAELEHKPVGEGQSELNHFPALCKSTTLDWTSSENAF